MIPYQDMTFGDYNFYWGESVIFTKIEGEWTPVLPHNMESDGESYRFSTRTRLEEIEKRGNMLHFTVAGTNKGVKARPMEIFESADWITYEPTLGYFILSDKLLLVTSSVPRSRHKGLNYNRLSTVCPVDEAIVSPELFDRLILKAGYNLPLVDLAYEVAFRMNNPFPDSWYLAIMRAIDRDEAVILENHVCAIPDKENSVTHILFQGAMLGHVVVDNTRLEFIPRKEPTTSLESAVCAYMRSKLVTVMPREATSNG